MIQKPKECGLCPIHYSGGLSFIRDIDGPKVAVVLPQPLREDGLTCEPLSSPMGRWWLLNIVEPAGLKKEDLLLMHALRCIPTREEKSATIRSAMQICRRYDEAITRFRPSLALLSCDMDTLRKTPAYRKLAIRHLTQAHDFYRRGYRPVILVGLEPGRLLMPWIGDSAKKWYGTWQEIKGWPFAPSIPLSPAEDDTPPWE